LLLFKRGSAPFSWSFCANYYWEWCGPG